MNDIHVAITMKVMITITASDNCNTGAGLDLSKILGEPKFFGKNQSMF